MTFPTDTSIKRLSRCLFNAVIHTGSPPSERALVFKTQVTKSDTSQRHGIPGLGQKNTRQMKVRKQTVQRIMESWQRSTEISFNRLPWLYQDQSELQQARIHGIVGHSDTMQIQRENDEEWDVLMPSKDFPIKDLVIKGQEPLYQGKPEDRI